MDYKSKLNDLVAGERSLSEAKELERKKYYEGTGKAFAPLAAALQEISETVDSKVASFSIGPYSAKIQIGSTAYEVQPNYSRFNIHQSEPGFRISTLTTYKYADVESSALDYVLKSAEDVTDDLMKLLAKALVSKSNR
ncbi:MAG: hypothetical protein ACLPLZ_11625 [Terracidiphilus sp.]